MAWMIVHREGNFRRPKSKFSFNFKPSPQPQSWPRDVVKYAVESGAAEKISPPPRRTENARSGAKGE